MLCDNSKALTCSNCPDGQKCQISIPMDCKSCPRAICVPDENASAPPPEDNSPSAGAIAGGVIGGLAAIAILTYLVWRFCIKNKRDPYEGSWQQDAEHAKEGVEKDFASRRSQRASTHTVNSIASTVLTRASNIIQIAYIPGVTNRATPTSPTVLVPPVPPIPLAHSEAGSHSPYEDQHFFVPGDLRDSTYSGYSGVSDRTSYAPRSSVASTIYGKNAVVSPLPAQKGNFLKPSLVSVKSRAGSSHSESSTPPVPTVDYEKYENGGAPSPAFSIGATFFKNATTTKAQAVRPQIVRVGNGPKQVDVGSKTSTPSEKDGNESSVEVSEVPEKEKDSAIVTVIEKSPATTDQGPFADPPAKSTEPTQDTKSLGAVAENTPAERASHGEKRNSSSSVRDQSPFSDKNALKEN